MASKKQHLLSEWISGIYLGKSLPDKGEFSRMSQIAKEFEAGEMGESFRNLAAQISALQDENENLQAERDRLIDSLKAKNGEYERIMKQLSALERQKEEEANPAKLPNEQWKILALLQPEAIRTIPALKVYQKIRSIPPDEIEWHLRKLKELKYAGSFRDVFQAESEVWFRTELGNRIIIARRRAGEEVSESPHRKYDPLTDVEEEILICLKSEKEGQRERRIHAYLELSGLKISLDRTCFLLRRLEDMQMTWPRRDRLYSGGGPDAGPLWFIAKFGQEYLDERNLL
jgi:hypothetical protein